MDTARPYLAFAGGARRSRTKLPLLNGQVVNVPLTDHHLIAIAIVEANDKCANPLSW